MNTAIIVAAGSGKRFDSATPKQFLELKGKPIIIRTLEKFQACDSIDAIVVVTRESDIKMLGSLAADAGISKLRSVVAGGGSRAESMRKGFAAVDPATTVVCVHDGVRPFVTVDEIDGTIDAAVHFAAACLVALVTDTIKIVDYNKITGTIDRTTLRRALTPQAFRYGILSKALENAELSDAVTDECSLVENTGVMITTVEGSPRNIKITHAEDMILAEAFLAEELR
ncbi:MAG: 2-C-methyl-D-erythritol 4-phosphate cytidylyltransferase [Acidobacteriota bacterium]